MYSNGFRSRTSNELTEYQKKVTAVESVILCVAEAERMIWQIGWDLVPVSDPAETRAKPRSFAKSPPRAGRRNFLKD